MKCGRGTQSARDFEREATAGNIASRSPPSARRLCAHQSSPSSSPGGGRSTFPPKCGPIDGTDAPAAPCDADESDGPSEGAISDTAVSEMVTSEMPNSEAAISEGASTREADEVSSELSSEAEEDTMEEP
eukprot:scaffold187477_cov32-Tisochrysis_lutea.AAC.3